MRKTLELLALSTCTAALCVTLTGCEAVKGTASGEKPVKTGICLPAGRHFTGQRTGGQGKFVCTQ